MKFKRKVLPNGLRVVTIPMADNPTVTVLVTVEAGSKYETKDINGLSHFLEHMCFKGTTNRPKASDISRELDGLGAHYNAFTSQEYTGYYAKAEARHLDKILDVISDMYLHPVFDEKEIEKEKGVIAEEINMYEDLPQRKVDEVFTELLYGNQPAGWSIAGTKEIVRKMTRDNFVDYRKKNYLPPATSLIIAGNFDEKSIYKKIDIAFKGMPEGKKQNKLKVKEVQTSPQVAVFNKETDQSHIIVGVRTFDTYNKKRTILSVLSSVLGGGMSSRLFQKLRDELGVCYYVRTGADLLTDHGTLAVSAGLDNSRVKIAVEAILAEFKRLRDELVSPEELTKVKNQMTGNFTLGLESSDSLAEYYGFQEIYHKELKKPEEIKKEILAVTAKDIQKLAREIFKNEKLNLAMVGKGKKEDFNSWFHL
ncbi:MAG: pitrilysin family protein [Minisyncoccia bacterium]